MLVPTLGSPLSAWAMTLHTIKYSSPFSLRFLFIPSASYRPLVAFLLTSDSFAEANYPSTHYVSREERCLASSEILADVPGKAIATGASAKFGA